MAAQLTTHNAQITTATVQIKTLTISGKQVTLAVFRQLREEQLIADDGTLNGKPWGTVNYCPPKCPGRSNHLHVVWQRDDELLRATVRPVYSSTPFYSEACDEFVQQFYCANGHCLLPWMRRRRDPDEPGEWCIGFTMPEFRGIDCITVGEPAWPGNGRAGHQCKDDPDTRKWFLEDLAEEDQRRTRIKAHWEILTDRQQTPQLFIAV